MTESKQLQTFINRKYPLSPADKKGGIFQAATGHNKRRTVYRVFILLFLVLFLPMIVSAQQSVVSFTLINANNNQPVAGFDPIPNGAVINTTTIGTSSLNIRANTSPAIVGSVRFGFDANPSFKIESASPYAIFGDNGGVFNGGIISAGSHTLTGTPFTGSGATGTAGTPRTITFTVESSGSGSSISVVKLTLINAETDQVVPGFDPMPDNATIDLSQVGTSNLSIRAFTNPTSVGSVRFGLDGNNNVRTENAAPYTIAGDNGATDFFPINFAVGSHTVTVTPFTQSSGGGTAGTPMVRNFNVVNGTAPTMAVVTMTLINCDTDRPVPGFDPMPDNAVIDRSVIGTNNLTVRANTSPSTVGSVRFNLDGNTNFRTENVAPYSLGGEASGSDFLPVNFFEGNHTLIATPFAQSGGSGVAGTALTRRFSITGFAGTGKPVPPSLKTVQVPGPDKVPGFNFSEFVVNRDAAIRLGKALFWDMQAGSDGIQACASCHFHAGADNRSKNQVSPGANGALALNRGANAQLTLDSYPFFKSDDDATGSQGVFNTRFNDIVLNSAVESGTRRDDNVFHVGGIEVRQVTPRNSTTVINAVYSYRSFWDGRANPVFNGVNELGPRDQNARVLAVTGSGVVPVRVAIPMSTLASQATAPQMNTTEMSFEGRTFPKIGKKLLSLPPLAKQLVHPNDSRLGALSNSPNRGLKAGTTYASMIREAFNSKWWDSDAVITFDSQGNPTVQGPKTNLTTNEFTLMEANFSLFWGLAIQLYEATLVSDNSLFDRVREGSATFTDQQQRGLDLFMGKGRCVNCHSGPEFTDASVTFRNKSGDLNRLLNRNGQAMVVDAGFLNIGIRGTNEDLGIGINDKFGRPFSFATQAVNGLSVDTFRVVSSSFDIPGPVQSGERTGVRGAFKIPTLRNVEFTAPYFHDGTKATLRELLNGYNAGQNFRVENADQMPADIRELGLTFQEIGDIVAFLLTLTDPRVRTQSAPFDHPQLFVPNGHPGNNTQVTNDGTGKATDQLLEIVAVGASGGPSISPFLNGNPFVGKDVAEEDAESTESEVVPHKFVLEQNFPNPFNPVTTIRYSIANEGIVRLVVYDILGKEVATLVNENLKPGNYSAMFDGSALSSGIYLYKLEAPGFSQVRKLVLMK